MSSKVTGVLIDIGSGFFGKATLDGSLESYCRALKCTCFDITYRSIGGTEFAVYCDDEGLLKQDPVPSAFTADGRPQLVGNLFIARIDEEGETISLTDSEIEQVIKQVRIGMFTLRNQISVQPFLLVD